MIAIYRADAKELYSEEGSPLAGVKYLSEMRKIEAVEYLTNQVKTLSNF